MTFCFISFYQELEKQYNKYDSHDLTPVRSSLCVFLFLGTGKTLSLICSVLQWLQDRRSSQVSEEKADSSLSIKDEDNTSVNLESEPQWLREFCKANSGKQQKNATKNVKRKTFSSKILNISSEKKNPQVDSSHRDHGNVLIQDQDQDEEIFLLDDYDSGVESGFEKNSRKRKVYHTSDGSSDEEVDLEEGDSIASLLKALAHYAR